MTDVVIASADQSLVFQLSNATGEMDGVRVVHAAYSTDDLVSAVLRLDPDVVLVDEGLGPAPVIQVIRDLGLRKPTCATVVISEGASAETFGAAMEAGARGLVTVPVQFEDLRARLESAAGISANLRRMLAPAAAPDPTLGRARLVAFAGAKGGVGTTSIATHLAMDLVRESGDRVCLVDLDLEKGDVSALIDVRHKASVADVAKVADDLSSRAVADAVVVHESGLHLLLAPTDLRDVEAVTPRALREILAVLRQDYDAIVVDVGAHVTPQQAAVVEVADEVVTVTTPDVLSLRGLKRSISHWESLGVRKETDLRVLVTRASRQSSVSPEAVRQITRAQVMSVAVPSIFRRLEPALNAREPYEVREQIWWRSLRRIQKELSLHTSERSRGGASFGRPHGAPDPAAPDAVDGLVPHRTGRRGRRADSGSVALELVGVLPAVLVVIVVAWQLAVYGMSAVWVGHAASVAARAQSVGADPSSAARDCLPEYLADDLSVRTSGSSVTVSLRVPLVAPGIGPLPARVSSTRSAAREP